MPKGIYTRGKINRKSHTQKTKDKMSLVRRGIKLSDETKEKIRKAKTGVKYPNRKKYFKGKTITRKICLFCGKEFVANYSIAKRVKFCSLSCSSKSRPSGMKGKKQSERQKEMMRKKNGKLHPNWIKDRTKLKKQEERNGNRHKQWSREVKRKTGWKCKIDNKDCKGKIEAHHILSWKDYPELRYDYNNGIPLCKFHHPKKRADEKRLIPYFQKLNKT